jgi:hypothetical protein
MQKETRCGRIKLNNSASSGKFVEKIIPYGTYKVPLEVSKNTIFA